MIKPHEQRVIIELAELELKIYGLARFLANNKLDDTEILSDQYNAMITYRDILTVRIDAF